MRLEAPRTNSVTIDGGAASLTFEKPSLTRDVPGNIFMFRMDAAGPEAKVLATVFDSTVLHAMKQANSEGLDQLEWSYNRRLAYVLEHAEAHGRTFEVNQFSILQCPEAIPVETLRDKFCELLAEYASSYRYNSADYSEGFDGYFDDTIVFMPHDQDRLCHTVVRLSER